MANIIVIEQWVDSMDKAVSLMEKAINEGNKDEVNRMRTTIFALHQKIDEALSKNV